MSQVRETTSHDPFKPCKFFAFSTEKPCARLVILISLVTTISFLIYSAFPDQSWWLRFPEHLATNNGAANAPETLNSGHYYETYGNISGENVEPTNISHILFGIGGSVATWKDRSHYTELWWNPNLTRGFVWLDEKPGKPSPWPQNLPPYKVSEDWTHFKYSSSQSAIRIARIVLESFKLGLPDVRWFVMGDDDTVFFTDNLVSMLARYDHQQMYYIGGNSESVEQDVMHSYDMAFGGGGFAISYPLAAELVKVLDGCIDRYYTFYGSDQRIWACISEIGVSLTRERGFHQFDIRGDPYGLLAAHPIAPLVSLHHLDYLKPIFPDQSRLDSLKSLIRAYRVDPARLLQQSFCHHHERKWSVSVAWGYTVQIYPSLLPPLLLELPMQTFQTWRSWSNGPFAFNTRPARSELCEKPLIYFLDRVEEAGNGETVTSYNRIVGYECERSDYAPAIAVRRITVHALKMDQEDWKKAPRRHCCEMMDRGSIKNGILRVRIRRCKLSETTVTT